MSIPTVQNGVLPLRVFVSSCFLLAAAAAPAAEPPKFELADGDRVVFVGNTFLERENHYGCIETMLMRLHPGKKITFRNLAWSGDTVYEQMRPLNFGSLEEHVAARKPTWIIASFGMGESFEGAAGLPAFEKGLNEILDRLSEIQPRIVLISPIRHEHRGPPLPDPEEHVSRAQKYVDVMRTIASARGLPFVDLFEWSGRTRGAGDAPLTDNGIHLTADGYRHAAAEIAGRLVAGAGPERPSADAQAERLRAVVVEKNRLWFHRWRDHNGEYIYGRRAKAFPGNAGNDQFLEEHAALDKLLREADEKIRKLAVPVPHTYELAPEK